MEAIAILVIFIAGAYGWAARKHSAYLESTVERLTVENITLRKIVADLKARNAQLRADMRKGPQWRFIFCDKKRSPVVIAADTESEAVGLFMRQHDFKTVKTVERV